MEENIFDALPGFDRLLEEKAFEALSVSEKEHVLQYISEEDYRSFRELALAARRQSLNGEQPITPDPSVKSSLMQAIDADQSNEPASSVRTGNIPTTMVATDILNNRSSVTSPGAETAPGALTRFLTYRIPLYQAGLAASVLLFLVFYVLLQNYRLPGPVAVTDTVYVEKPLMAKDSGWNERPEADKQQESQRALDKRSEANKQKQTQAVQHRRPEGKDREVMQDGRQQIKGRLKPGDAMKTQFLPENPLYASQMQDALGRMSVIAAIGKEKSMDRDAGLMKLVSPAVHAISLP